SARDTKTKALPIPFSVRRGKLQSGRYTCQVSVLDPQAQKFAYWRAPIVMVQQSSSLRRPSLTRDNQGDGEQGNRATPLGDRRSYGDRGRGFVPYTLLPQRRD